MTINPLDITTYPIALGVGAAQEVVAARAGQRWLVISTLICTAAVNATVIVNSGGTAVTGTMPIPVNTILDLDWSEPIWVGRVTGENLNMTVAVGAIAGFVNVVWMK